VEESTRILLRSLPSVEELAGTAEAGRLVSRYSRTRVVEALRVVLADVRRALMEGDAGAAAREGWVLPSYLLTEAAGVLSAQDQPRLGRVLNATGVVVHTNLGRSLLAPTALERVVEVASHYSNLEYDLEAGTRGSRHEHVSGLLAELTGAEAALVVNNNAAATLLMLSALAAGREVIVSRGQLVEIGGSFRIPDIMRQSGARLVEVGTTNKTRSSDFERALSEETALLLRVHTSNFKMVGFTEEVSIAELAALGAPRGIPVADDLGSGALVRLPTFADEPAVSDSLRAGADLVTFSGDKLLGGPQAGLIVGGRIWVQELATHPLARAFRVDKMTLAALEGTLMLYRDPEKALESIPTLRFMSRGPAETERLAGDLKAVIEKKCGGLLELEVEASEAKAGGGALPLLELPSHAVALRIVEAGQPGVSELAAELRRAPLPVIARVSKAALHLDVAALRPEELELVADAVAWALSRVGREDIEPGRP